MTFYDEMADVADELLGEFKQGAVKLIVAPDASGGDEWNPTAAATTETEHDLKAAVRGIADSLVDGTLIKKGDLMVTFAVPEGVTPSDEHMMSIDGVRYAIEHLEQVPAAGTPVAFKARVRR